MDNSVDNYVSKSAVENVIGNQLLATNSTLTIIHSKHYIIHSKHYIIHSKHLNTFDTEEAM